MLWSIRFPGTSPGSMTNGATQKLYGLPFITLPENSESVTAISRDDLVAHYRTHYVAPRAVVMGNAAQTLHPIGAQGFNLGLRDALTLAEVLSGDDPGAAAALALDRRALWRRVRRSARQDHGGARLARRELEQDGRAPGPAFGDRRAHGRFEQHRDVASGRDRQGRADYRHAEDVLRLALVGGDDEVIALSGGKLRDLATDAAACTGDQNGTVAPEVG